MTSNTEQTETPATATAERKAAQKAHTRARRANVAPARAKSSKKARPAKKAHNQTARKPKAARTTKAAKENGVCPSSKTATILDLLKRRGGATAKELMKATGWQPHSVRGFLSGTVGKKMGLYVESAKGDGGERSYSVTD